MTARAARRRTHATAAAESCRHRGQDRHRDRGRHRAERGGVLRGLLLGLLPLVLLLVAAELLLALLGLGGAPTGAPLSRGFDPGAAYLLPDPGAPGGWRTQIFDGLSPEVVVPPKGAATRVLLLGGSNTQSFPGAELQRQLVGAAGGADFEVINLGRAGYGSERVAILAAQAAVLDPDVVVIYSGHNEFVEGGFRLEIEAAAPGWLARTGDALAGLRSYRVVAQAFGGAGGGGLGRGGPAGAGPAGSSGSTLGDGVPERVMLGADADTTGQVGGESRALTDLDYAETLAFYAAYERNLRAMVTALLEDGVGVVLCTVVPNDLLGPTASGYPRDLSAADRAAAGKLLKRAFALVPERLREHMFPPAWLRVHDWGELLFSDNPEQRERAQPGRAVPPLRPLLGALANPPATSGPNMDSTQGAHWPDPSLWSERVHDLLAVQSAWLRGPLDADEQQRLALARARFDEALQIVPGHPLALFWSGLCSLGLGDGATAAARLEAAGRFDRAPRRGNAITNGSVRELADELATRGRLVLLDADALFRERTPDGILGYEVLMDMCHLQPGARAVLMSDLVAPVLAVAPDP